MNASRLNKCFALALIAAHLLLLACSDTPMDVNVREQPPLPPATSMASDINLFNSPGALGKPNAAGQNFQAAVLAATAINLSVALIMLVPTATLAAALSQQPVLKEDGKFHWIFTTATGGITYRADLAGWIDVPVAESVWEMRISTDAPALPLTNFLWYSGRAKLTNLEGYWDVFDVQQPNASVNVLHIDWEVPSETQATVVYTAVKPNESTTDDRLTYNIDGNDRLIEFFDKSNDGTLTIFWDAATTAGYIIAPGYRGGQKSCWNAGPAHDDVDCP